MNQVKPQRIAVVGLGLLGRGIAACFLGHGFEVVVLDKDEQNRKSAREHIAEMIDELVQYGGFAPGLRQEWPARYLPANSYDALRDCSFIVESITEDAAAKHEAFDQIEAHIAGETVIASNSSAIPITQLQQGRKNPGRFLAMHWAEPAHATRFLEIIRGEKTSDASIQKALGLARTLGKEPVVLQKEVAGFIVNRIGYAMYREALHLLESGVADAESIDLSMRNALGLWATMCGPLRWIDLTGGPELYAKAMQNVFPVLNNSPEIPGSLKKLAESGARGIANGRGFYCYTPEEAKRWSALYRRHAWRVAQIQNEYFPIKEELRP